MKTQAKTTETKAPLLPATRSLFGMGRRVARVIFDKAKEADEARRFGGAGYYDQDAEIYVMRGGVWNSTPDRVASGFTKADVEDVRRKMRALGYAATFEQVDNLLQKAQYIRDEQNARKRRAIRRAA